ncbi:MFS transporter [Mesorhizobium sp. YC-39]|uniref:MFS transporter n=1 Tax=unclassified Mesorhizobium TaxID=325217 RepID=UPI0021E7AB01|nr:MULTISPECIES: MFS transporter [unclassified Mesorhizobium]MCV3205669.1 MFS transporter [Mesorhizobium sp. YC-2]MCV3227932.1 MFS transporter [Mesorhizobium sp. YC-39]
MANRNTNLTNPPVDAVVDAISAAPGFFGWRVVAAAFTVAVFGWGTGFYGPPVYLEVVHQTRGWSIALISGAVTLHFLVGLALIPNLPGLYRRFGLPIVTFAGGVIMALGVLGWALANTPWQLYAAAVLSGIGWSVLGAVAINAIVSPWFAAKRPLALGVAFNGGSVGGVIFSPFWVALIDRVGFPAAALVVSAAMLATLGALAGLVLTRTPESLNQVPDGSPSTASALRSGATVETSMAAPRFNLFRDRAFLTLCIGMTLALFAQTGLVAHLVSVLAPTLGRQGAGLAAGASGVAAVIGRVAIGWRASSTSNWRAIASYSLVAQTLGCGVLLLADSPALLVVGVVLFGLGVGNAISVPPVIANLEFSKEDAARAVALIVAISQGAYAIAPAVFGLFRELWSDQIIFVASVAIQVAAIAAYLLGAGRAASPHDAID